MANKLEEAVYCLLAREEDLEKTLDFTLEHLANNHEVLVMKIQLSDARKAFYAGLITYEEYKKVLTSVAFWLFRVVKNSSPMVG